MSGINLSVLKSGCSKYRFGTTDEEIGESIRIFHTAKNGHTGIQWILKLKQNEVVKKPCLLCDELYIDIYREHFVYIDRVFQETDLIKKDYYPDALIPFKSDYVTKKDGLFIIYFDIYCPIVSKVGKKDLSFSVQIGDDVFKENAELIVHNCTVSPVNHIRSCFLMPHKDIEYGEGYIDNELVRTYYETLLEYRINAYSLPSDFIFNAKQLAEEVDRYFDNPMFTTYALQNEVGGFTSAISDEYDEQIFELAERSCQGRNLLSKAFTYFYDEADEAGTTADALEKVNKYKKGLKRVADAIENDNTSRFVKFRNIDNWRKSVEDLPCVGTIHFRSKCAELINNTGIWCPSWVGYDDKDIRNKFTNIAKKEGKELWWYGCMGPTYPMPTYHIDDYLLSSRIVSWMQCAYDVKGNLYWNAVGYAPGSPVSKEKPESLNLFESPYKANNLPAGDGFLFYPGKDFGENKPIPSLRLMSVRDGMEDYELLLEAEKVLIEQGKDKWLLYGDMFEGLLYDINESRFLFRREKMLNLFDGKDDLIEQALSTSNCFEIGEKILESVQIDQNGKFYLSRNGSGDGYALELYAIPQEDRWINAYLDINKLAVLNDCERVVFTIKNFESRSLTVFIYLEENEKSFLCQARELYENTCMYVDIPYKLCAKGMNNPKFRLKFRNTYPNDERYSIRIAIDEFNIKN